jgi:hypothetical protein
VTLTVATKAVLTPALPAVGISWCVNNNPVVDLPILAEPYGDWSTHAAGKYELLQDLQALGMSQLTAID